MNFSQLRHSLLEGTPLTPRMLANAGWEETKVQTSVEPTYVKCWEIPSTKEDRKVYVIFPEGDSGNYIVRIGGPHNFTYAFTSKYMEALCTFLMLQFPRIEFESPSDILKMFGV
jgi:hypothetical protein